MAKFIKFREKASVTAAKADTTAKDGRMDVVASENALVYEANTVIRGITDAQKTWVDGKIKEENDKKATISFDVTPVGPFVRGVSTEFTLTVTCKFDDTEVDADALPTMTAGSSSVTVTKKSTGVYTGTVNATDKITFKVDATVKGVPRSDSKIIYAYNHIYYGTYAESSVPEEPSSFFAGLKQYSKLVGSVDGVQIPLATGGYNYLLVPTIVNSGKLPKAWDVTGESQNTNLEQLPNAKIKEIEYKVYRTQNVTTLANTITLKA